MEIKDICLILEIEYIKRKNAYLSLVGNGDYSTSKYDFGGMQTCITLYMSISHQSYDDCRVLLENSFREYEKKVGCNCL